MRWFTPHEGTLWRRLACAIGLSLYFFAVYGACTAITARRSDVGHAAFGWERYIPFVPVMIIPYMSVDLFFFGAPLLCGARARTRHARRIVLAITLAGICFLLFPLQMTTPRPPAQGPWGPVFKFLYGFDKPYNLAPSLHIALRSLLWVIYVPLTRGLLRAAVTVWFVLIGVSTLLTYQHQVIDVVTGQFLGLLCLHLCPDGPEDQRPSRRNYRIAALYACGAALLIVAGYLLRPWGLLLLWPAGSLSIIASAYMGAGPAVFRKRAGRLPLSTQVMLLPFLVGMRCVLQFYQRREVPFCEVIPGLFIGRQPRRSDASLLRARGVRSVLDLTAEFSEQPDLLALTYLNLPVLDLTPPRPDQLEDAVAFIAAHLSEGGVYVHCALGYSRSACAVAAYLLASRTAATIPDAIATIRIARPRLVMGEALQAPLRIFEGGTRRQCVETKETK